MRYETKLRLLIVLTILLVVLVSVAVALEIMTGEKPLPTEPVQLQTQAPTDPPVTLQPTREPTQAPTTEPTEPPTEEPTEAPTVAPTKPPVKPTQPPVVVKPTNPPAPKPTEPPMLSFPYVVPGSDLVIREVRSYDGIFLEDGSDRAVTGITALVLENRGKVGVEYAEITLTRENGTKLQFKASSVPAGSSVVVQELNAAAYVSSAYASCTADVALLEKFEMSTAYVKVEENEDGSLNVTNLTGQTIPCVRVFYKFALDKDIYVGGITYTAKLVELAPGDTQRITPSHFAYGSSKVMMVRTYETAE